MKFHTQGFEQSVINNAKDAEEASFIKSIMIVLRDCIPSGSNVVNSHTVYKTNTNDKGSLKLRARIASHGNEDDLRSKFSTDCSMCPHMG